jgi:IrrE N-terminal-like domain
VKNQLLLAATTADIEGQVGKILRGLGYPEPPVNLDDVRTLLNLDRQYYSTTNTNWVDSAISRLRIATKQVVARPTLLFDAIAKWNLRGLYLPDRKRILIDEAVPTLKQRWIEGHEITHGILPWHAELMLGDTEQTLNPACHEYLEAEANYGAGQLLFPRRRFIAQVGDLPATIDSVRQLSTAFGNTMTSTLWRFVETVHAVRRRNRPSSSPLSPSRF